MINILAISIKILIVIILAVWAITAFREANHDKKK